MKISAVKINKITKYNSKKPIFKGFFTKDYKNPKQLCYTPFLDDTDEDKKKDFQKYESEFGTIPKYKLQEPFLTKEDYEIFKNMIETGRY